jgi:hypothetical protein
MKRIFIVLLVVILAIGMLLPAAGVLATPVCSGPIPTPRVITNPVAPDPADVGYSGTGYFSYKINSPPASGTFNDGTYRVDWTITDDGKKLAFSNASPGITAVIIKGGNQAHVYDYNPTAISDCGLVSPNMNNSTPAISYMTFIWQVTTTTTDITATPSDITEVGGTIYPISKGWMIAPAIALIIAILTGTVILVKRHQV